MNRIEYLLTCLSEECGEVVQITSKMKRFGVGELRPNKTETNLDNLVLELHDIVAVYEMLFDTIEFPFTIDRERIQAKKDKVLKYMEYSKERGTLSDDP